MVTGMENTDPARPRHRPRPGEEPPCDFQASSKVHAEGCRPLGWPVVLRIGFAAGTVLCWTLQLVTDGGFEQKTFLSIRLQSAAL